MSPVVPQRGDKFTIPGRYLLLILTVFCISLIIVSLKTDILSKPINAIGGFFVTPLQNGISKAGTYLNDRAEKIEQLEELAKENDDLRDQIDELTIENIKLQQEKYELTRLRELYDLDSQYDSYEKVGARVIAKDAGNWFHVFVINKGSDDGLKVDMNVMAGSGLVGRIIEVSSDWSKVLSIIDDSSNVSGMVLSTSDNLIISGNLRLYEEGVISYEKLIDNGDLVSEGDKVVTSNISNKFLPGILIGYISSINDDTNNLTKSGYITPAVDFEHLSEVLVILRNKQTVG